MDTIQLRSQLRLTAYRLEQLQERHDQTSNINRRDIATLLGRAEISAARIKAEKLVHDDRLCTLIERLESYCNLLLERFAELGQAIDFESDSPLSEAVCSLLLAPSRTELQDIVILRDMLVQIYGLDFKQLAKQYSASRIPTQVLDAIDQRPPPAVQIDVYLTSIAKEYSIPWTPPLLPHQKAHILSEILDQNTYPRRINFEELRQICSRGIPPHPPWLRPRVWKLLLGVLSNQKDSWEVEAYSKRRSYYDLARTLLTRLTESPSPTEPLSSIDVTIFNMAKSLSAVSQGLHWRLECSPLCPFDDSAPDGLRIEVSGAVDQRLRLIQGCIHGTDGVTRTAVTCSEPADFPLQTPQISLSSPESPISDSVHKASGTVLHSSGLTRSHITPLLRLVYIHMAFHPSASIACLTNLLIPLYVAMAQEIEPADLAHVEADTFWLLTELWGEIAELSEEEGGHIWVAKLGGRLAQADPELSEDLARKGLDPGLPHYSYRWLVPLLTRTLPLPSVLTIWDALFTQASRTSDYNAKLEFALDICTSMLINAREKLFRLAIPAAAKSSGLWGDVNVTTLFPYTPIEFGECFNQGMAFLQDYPMDELGGPERVIDIAVGLNSRSKSAKGNDSILTLGERLRGWSELVARASPVVTPTSQSDNESDGILSPRWPDSSAEDEGDKTESPGGALLEKLGKTVWRGITNQSSMEVPSSPLPPVSPNQTPSPADNHVKLSSSNSAAAGAVRIGSRLSSTIWRGITNQSAMEGPPSPTESSMTSPSRFEGDGSISPNLSSSFWGYPGRLRDSDTAASLSKTSTNLTAKASALWRKSNPSSAVSSPSYITQHARTESLGLSNKSWTATFPKRGSLPTHYAKEYSPPPKPSFRESRYFFQEERSLPGSPSSSITGLPSPPDLLAKSKTALASLTGTATVSAPKSGPRPLLLSSSSLITPSNPRRRSPTPVSSPPPQTRDSMSSASSASPTFSATRNSTYSDRDSEPYNGRFVPLRRGPSRRPIRASRTGVARTTIQDESIRHVNSGIESEPFDEVSNSTRPRTPEKRVSSKGSVRRGWDQIELLDSPSTLPSSPPPKTPTTWTSGTSVLVGGESERQHHFSTSSDAVHSPADKGVGRKKSWNVVPLAPPLEATSDSSTSQENALPLRNKRYGQRPANLRLKKSDSDLGRSGTAPIEHRSSGDFASLMPDSLSEVTANTPRATYFPPPDSPGCPIRVRRSSRSPRRAIRKSEMSMKGSGGEEGDDEGYDEFLSAYESEDSAQAAAARMT